MAKAKKKSTGKNSRNKASLKKSLKSFFSRSAKKAKSVKRPLRQAAKKVSRPVKKVAQKAERSVTRKKPKLAPKRAARRPAPARRMPLPEEMKPAEAPLPSPGGDQEEETGMEEAQSRSPSIELHEGDQAPDFNLLNDEGREISLSGFRGKKVVLYFYPKDDTPGCTKEACSFRDGISEIQARGAVVLGVSTDPVGSHQAFKEKHHLNFPLLSDINKEVVQKYGVWKERTMYGRTSMGIERTTFVIDEGGRIARIFPKVDVEQHYDEVLASLA